MKKNTDNPWRMIGLISSIGVELLVFIVAGAWLGRLLDDRFQTGPLWLGIGLIAGMLVGGISATLIIRSLMKE
ncbi:AtpZ/AtpI family protein [Kroppenstedtia pulmonis]|nr:AtpZ/AtpI family protein [Kroppenstedtia pulmonis]